MTPPSHQWLSGRLSNIQDVEVLTPVYLITPNNDILVIMDVTEIGGKIFLEWNKANETNR